jgi:hypothetical protein
MNWKKDPERLLRREIAPRSWEIDSIWEAQEVRNKYSGTTTWQALKASAKASFALGLTSEVIDRVSTPSSATMQSPPAFHDTNPESEILRESQSPART